MFSFMKLNCVQHCFKKGLIKTSLQTILSFIILVYSQFHQVKTVLHKVERLKSTALFTQQMFLRIAKTKHKGLFLMFYKTILKGFLFNYRSKA